MKYIANIPKQIIPLLLTLHLYFCVCDKEEIKCKIIWCRRHLHRSCRQSHHHILMLQPRHLVHVVHASASAYH